MAGRDGRLLAREVSLPLDKVPPAAREVPLFAREAGLAAKDAELAAREAELAGREGPRHGWLSAWGREGGLAL